MIDLRDEGARLSVGELMLLRAVGPRHAAGVPFDAGEVAARRHDLSGRRADVREVFGGCAQSLVAKGLMRPEAGGLFSLTERGEAYWKESVAGDWKHARQGAGVSWKGGRE